MSLVHRSCIFFGLFCVWRLRRGEIGVEDVMLTTIAWCGSEIFAFPQPLNLCAAYRETIRRARGLVYVNRLNVDYALTGGFSMRGVRWLCLSTIHFDRSRVSPESDLLQARFDHVFLLTVVLRMCDAFRARQKRCEGISAVTWTYFVHRCNKTYIHIHRV